MSSVRISPEFYAWHRTALLQGESLNSLREGHAAGTLTKTQRWNYSAIQTLEYLQSGCAGAPPSFTAWLISEQEGRGIVGHLARRWVEYSAAWVGFSPDEVRAHLAKAGWLTPSYSEALEVAAEEFEGLARHGIGIPHVLYRFFAANGELLYIGLTLNPGTRWKKHAKEKPWWIEVVGITLEHFPSREAVEAAEVAAIKAERPVYNIQHNRRYEVSA